MGQDQDQRRRRAAEWACEVEELLYPFQTHGRAAGAGRQLGGWSANGLSPPRTVRAPRPLLPSPCVFLTIFDKHDRTITGPNDHFYTSTLLLSRIPVFDGLWSHKSVCVWDAAAAHLAFEDALRRDPANVSGEAFLIAGNGPPWSMNNSRAALKVIFLCLPSTCYETQSDLEAHRSSTHAAT